MALEYECKCNGLMVARGETCVGCQVSAAVALALAVESRTLTAAYHDLCAVLGWAVDGKPATAEMVARAAKAVVKREQMALSHRGD